MTRVGQGSSLPGSSQRMTSLCFAQSGQGQALPLREDASDDVILLRTIRAGTSPALNETETPPNSRPA